MDYTEEHLTRHAGPCDGFGYQGDCSMCSGFIHREDGTIVHENGQIFAPVKIETKYEIKLDLDNPVVVF